MWVRLPSGSRASNNEKEKRAAELIIANKELQLKGYISKCNTIIQRKVKRPTFEQLIKEVEQFGYCGVGRKYGVSDNSIKKWIKAYKK